MWVGGGGQTPEASAGKTHRTFCGEADCISKTDCITQRLQHSKKAQEISAEVISMHAEVIHGGVK